MKNNKKNSAIEMKERKGIYDLREPRILNPLLDILNVELTL